MAEFPRQPVKPQQFFERYIPAAFAEAEHPPGTAEAEVKLGVRLDGEDGGEWLFELDHGKLSVKPGSREDAAFTVVQTVDDWRGALWEGRGGAFGRQALQMFQPGGAAGGTGPQLGGAPSPAALAQLRSLDGVIKMVVSEEGGDDWSVSFKLGPGPIPDEPTTTVTVSAADADAMGKGELDPMQAFMAGRIQVAGDMTLMMQMQAIQMQAAAQAAQGAKPVKPEGES